LIIDHLLWVHIRTRFAQARAELGMTDRTGGASSPRYAHRERPENFEEDDEEQSEGETESVLRGRMGRPGRLRPDEEEERANKQDLSLARSLRLRSEALEKVVTSMLDQPPTVHPHQDDGFPEPSTSPRLKPHSDASHPHTIPNGVRLRLALSTIVNDLFSRQAPPPPYRRPHRSSTSGSSNQTSVPTPDDSPVLLNNAPVVKDTTPQSPSLLPPVLMPLLDISGSSPLVIRAPSTGQSSSHPSAIVSPSPCSPSSVSPSSGFIVTFF
jgi:hypothetical protein